MRILKDLIVILLFTYGLLHMSYKYSLPDLANRDFVRYNKMIDAPLDMQATDAHFVLRQLPTLIARMIKEAGIYYPNEVAFRRSQYYKTDNDQRNFFALILSNYLALAAAMLMMVTYFRKYGDCKLLAVIACTTGYFMVPVSVIAPLAHGYGWLAVATITIALLERRTALMITGMMIAFFSRESVLLFFCPFIAFSLLNNKSDKFLRNALLLFILSVVVVFAAQLPFINRNENGISFGMIQATPGYISNGNFFSTTFIPQGVLAYLCYHLYQRSKKLVWIYLGAVAVLLLACIVNQILGPGRLIGETCPLLIILFCLPEEKLQAFVNNATGKMTRSETSTPPAARQYP